MLKNINTMRMKKIIAWPTAWALFWLGHLMSRPLNWEWMQDKGWAIDLFFEPYQSLMRASSTVQDWADLSGPWKKVNPPD